MNDPAVHSTLSFPSTAMAHLPAVLLQAFGEIQALLRSLRESRDALDHAAVQKLKHTSAKLLEVSSATEVAATGILDSLDRATAMVDELDVLEATSAPGAANLRDRLRDELFQSISCLQFQDITTQQLRHASSMLEDMEDRMARLAAALDPANLGGLTKVAKPPTHAQSTDFAPDATLANAQERQSLADNIFTAPV